MLLFQVTATVLNYHCGVGQRHLGYLSGATTVVANAGVVTFDAVSAYCWPLGNMTVQIQAQPSGFDTSHYVSTALTLVFRQCRDGEILVDNVCQACLPGSYSFHYSPTGTYLFKKLIDCSLCITNVSSFPPLMPDSHMLKMSCQY